MKNLRNALTPLNFIYKSKELLLYNEPRRVVFNR